MTPPALELPAGLAGAAAGPRTHAIDARWLMAYAAALGDIGPEYLDTLRPDGIVAHPLFPVCYEWPLAVEVRAVAALPEEIAVRGVHATHDLRIHRPVRAGDRLSTQAHVARLESRRPGAYVVTRFETVDAEGQPVTTTDYGSLYLGVGCPGAPAAALPDPPPALAAARSPAWTATVPIAANLAHVYTECARIWNPIHTDRAVARAAGLPAIILHGTATLALAVSQVLRRERRGPAAGVRRILCRFGAMVEMPSVITVEGLGATATGEGRWVAFRALTAEGRPAVRDGRLLVDE
ncbi:MAG: MaoC family dehydratase N-terminal domain-containing protein [Candidatus Rokubacteria bacterium]|nr:MaoC family dehydratase N-terminal domain-containing protein [Candidatus Rokubacteria bacterium]